LARDPGEDCAVEIRDEVMQPTSIQEIKLKVGMYCIITSAQGNGGVYIIFALRYILTIIILHGQENQVVLIPLCGKRDFLYWALWALLPVVCKSIAKIKLSEPRTHNIDFW